MRETLERYGVRTPIEIVPTGIPLLEFAGGDGMRFRAAHRIAPSRPVLLYVGRVASSRRTSSSCSGRSRSVRRDVPDALLVVCGEGPALARLRRLARDLGIGEAVQFVGYLDGATRLLDCYRAADAFVFASRTETQGLVLLEAMALGVPVVSTAVMGTRDIVGPERAALVADDDEPDFAAQVVRVLRDPELRARGLPPTAANTRAPGARRRSPGGWRRLYRSVLVTRAATTARATARPSRRPAST